MQALLACTADKIGDSEFVMRAGIGENMDVQLCLPNPALLVYIPLVWESQIISAIFSDKYYVTGVAQVLYFRFQFITWPPMVYHKKQALGVNGETEKLHLGKVCERWGEATAYSPGKSTPGFPAARCCCHDPYRSPAFVLITISCPDFRSFRINWYFHPAGR